MNRLLHTIIFIAILHICSCGSKSDVLTPAPDTKKSPVLNSMLLNGAAFGTTMLNTTTRPTIRLSFSQPINPSSLAAVILTDNNGSPVAINSIASKGDSVITVTTQSKLANLSKYTFTISTTLQSASGKGLQNAISSSFVTQLDSSRKFPVLSDNALLDTVQQRTLRYFWDFAHPVSGLIREGSKHDPDLVTSGGSGFGVMALLAGASRGFISRSDVLVRLQKMIGFLKNTAQTFHGAYPHWLNGSTGSVIPFSANDNGADIVETAYLIEGLVCARQYFNGAASAETNLRADINTIIDRVEWNWFRQNGQNVLYWHWSPDKGWQMNVAIQGWNECLISYVLAAASKNYSIPKTAYDDGWARGGAIKNGKTFYNIVLPLGEDYGGPLFFEHYSFLGINPNGLSDAYANYQQQTKNHTLINYSYCKTNPKNYFGYSDSVWGLTASDIKGGYTASSPNNDLGFIAPTAAIASLPYTPDESMGALKFFYYVLGNQLFKNFGFTDAFSLDVLKNNAAWFSDSYLAIDQGPIIVMIENYRSGLLWKLFMSDPEVRAGLTKLGFTGF
ncbi:glucoamylase family protein [Niabella soli]|uniref:Beta-glucosidase n=1 Tax=Niabella soli DSM 19437 TaxID=929713 RepID=W0F471_9BACT|nr:glucoamylase family protein [Niabella soli]AHF16244.1 hypothetical protein NIASO_15915 [Niabella soli DSM 19437]